MSRPAAYIAALVAGLAVSACVDRTPESVAPAPLATAQAPSVLCGDASRPCELDAIVVSSPRAAAVESAAVAARS